MPLGDRLKVAARAIVYCSMRIKMPSNTTPNWKSSELNEKEVELRKKAREFQEIIYTDMTKIRPSTKGPTGQYAAAMLAYDETFKDHKYGRCMTYASITGRFIKGEGEACKMATVLMNDPDNEKNEHVFIVMGDDIKAGQDCASWDDSTVVCDEWISHHPKSLKNALGNVGIYRGGTYADELSRLSYSTKIKEAIEVQRLAISREPV
jgi:hypothetical protein